jgi:hypothetical protein
MKRKTTPQKPPLKKGDNIDNNVDNSKYRNILLQNITAKYTVIDIKMKKKTEYKIQGIHEVEPRDFRKGNKDPLYTYTLLYGVTKFIKRKGETYIEDVCWVNIGCKGGEDFNRSSVISELSIANYGKYIFWEYGKSDPSQRFKHLRKFTFHPEEVARFNKDMEKLFRVVKRNPV